ncbi:MAG: hypothetical protein KDA89_18660 [Planctomycetaceae bacterium]|nr:hypothetical protein [Planctomycetaceae bacterium]
MSRDSHNPYEPPSPHLPPEKPVPSRIPLPLPLKALEQFSGIGPHGTVQYEVDSLAVYHWLKSGAWQVIYDAFLIPDVVRSPRGIWQGLSRPQSDGLYCIAGVPDLEFATRHKLGDLMAVQQSRIFLVFADSSFKIGKWRWENVDSDGSGLPTSYNTRFGKLVWQRSAS